MAGKAERSAKGTKGAKKTGPKLRKVGKATVLDESKMKTVIDRRLSVVFSHDVREHIFAVLSEKDSSPAEIGRGLGPKVDSNYLDYHFKVLEKNDLIELVERRKVRGVWENFYRAKYAFFFDGGDWECLPKTLKSGICSSELRSIYDDATKALVQGTFTARDDLHISWTTKLLDERGFRELNALLLETLEKVLTIAKESADRLAASSGESIPVTVALMGFEVPGDLAPHEEDVATD